MSDWGKYLKNAVANVEQQLDKVLLDQKEEANTAPVKSRKGRPDLAERLKQAANGRISPSQTPNQEQKEGPKEETDNNSGNDDKPDGVEQTDPVEGPASASDPAAVSAPAPELTVVEAFEIAPDLSPILNEAKKVALAIQRDDTLRLVDLLESAQLELNKYIESMSTRLQSLHSKLKVISADAAQSETGQGRQIALLMEEGQRLSQQELKLGLLLKKLRTERSTAQAKADSASQQLTVKETELTNLKAELELKTSSIRELEAMVEHFRATAETANKFMEVNSSYFTTNTSPSSASNREDSHELSSLLEEKFAIERSKWHIVEADLLARIAELEQVSDARTANFTRLQQSLAEAQKVSLESREQLVELQDQLDSTTEQHSLQESKLRSEISEFKVAEAALNVQIAQLNEEKQQQQCQIQELQEGLRHQTPVPYPYELEVPDHSVVGPLGPFGEYAEDFDPNYRPESPPHPDISDDLTGNGLLGEGDMSGAGDHTGISQLSSQVDDTSSFLRSRRESSIVGPEQGSNLNLVKRLTLQVRKLENELSVTKKATEFAKQQRDETQTELVKLVDTQDQLQQMEAANSELAHTNSELKSQIAKLESDAEDKTERIGELEADVRDLKDMYREQVEALVNEIEHLKTM